MEKLSKFVQLTEQDLIKIEGGASNTATSTSWSTIDCTNVSSGEGYDNCPDSDSDPSVPDTTKTGGGR